MASHAVNPKHFRSSLALGVLGSPSRAAPTASIRAGDDLLNQVLGGSVLHFSQYAVAW
jgi:hypothetical protein